MADDGKNNILICGGAGYVGGYVTDLLAARGHDVTVYDNLTYEDRYLKNARFIYGDVRDTEKLGRIINDFDIVVWLAAVVGDAACAINPALTKEINTASAAWLARNYTGKIVFASTCSVYGINNSVLEESSPVNPLSEYAATKLEAEKEIVEHSKNYLIFRLGTLFGIGDSYSRLRFDLVVNLLVQKAALGELLTVFGGGQWRPLLHVRDVAEAMVFGIENNVNGLFNLSDKNYKICDIADEIKRTIPHAEVEYSNVKFEDLRNYRVSGAKFQSCGWKPKYDLEYGIREVYQTIVSGRIPDPKNILYSNGQYLKNKLSLLPWRT